jgi:hypothetical protein
VTRSWNDLDGDYTPDCDLTLGLGNGECGTVSDTNFGRSDLVYSQTSDPRTVFGYGNRPYQWELSAGVQQQLLTRVSFEGAYFRRWRGNFTVVDNLALAPGDFDPFSVTAPVDERLPDGGGYTLAPFYDRNPAVVARRPVNVNMPASDYGEQTEMWQGTDLTVNARPRAGVVLQGGVSLGRQSSNNCEILAKVPEAAPLGTPHCDRVGSWRTQVKFVASYIVPKVDVQLSGALQSFEAPTILGMYVVDNSVVRTSLGRDLSAGARNVTVDLVQPGSMDGDRIRQVDLRLGKVVRLGGSRALVALDIYNLLNDNAALTENAFYRNTTISGWRIPTSILTARFFKISGQFNF